jgi:WD40 repeat protein
MAVGLDDGTIHILKVGEWGRAAASLGNQDVIRSLAFSPSGNLLASGGWDGSARIWETAKWTEISRLRLPSVVLGLAFTPDETRFAAAFNQMVYVDLVHSDDLIREACAHVTRPLRAEEWHLFLPSESPRPTCADAKP